MVLTAQKTLMRDLTVRETMRVQFVALPGSAPISAGIRMLLKYKISALLITDTEENPAGVVSKTDIMGAYYAGLPTETPLESIMNSPPLFGSPEDSLESALEMMRSNGVYRIYVLEEGRVVGVLAYPDIVGLLYQFCRSCDQSLMNRKAKKCELNDSLRFTVKEVMTPSVTSYPDEASLSDIMEGISTNRFGAVLIVDANGRPAGVISKTDLMLAYARGVDSPASAGTILESHTVKRCNEDDYVEAAVSKMIFSEIHRLFVYREDADNIVGVFSLSDAARVRSGSCRACVSSRIRIRT